MGNTVSNVDVIGSLSETGQSFINDPVAPNGSGTGINVFLNSFTFGFRDTTSQSQAALKTLTIFDGIGNGVPEIASATLTSTSAVSGISNPVTWTFASSVQLIETSPYSAVIRGVDFSIGFPLSNANPYPNGTATSNQFANASNDRVFRADFTLQPIPFEFSPALSLSILGGFCGVGVVAKKLKKAEAGKNLSS